MLGLNGKRRDQRESIRGGFFFYLNPSYLSRGTSYCLFSSFPQQLNQHPCSYSSYNPHSHRDIIPAQCLRTMPYSASPNSPRRRSREKHPQSQAQATTNWTCKNPAPTKTSNPAKQATSNEYTGLPLSSTPHISIKQANKHQKTGPSHHPRILGPVLPLLRNPLECRPRADHELG